MEELRCEEQVKHSSMKLEVTDISRNEDRRTTSSRSTVTHTVQVLQKLLAGLCMMMYDIYASTPYCTRSSASRTLSTGIQLHSIVLPVVQSYSNFELLYCTLHCMIQVTSTSTSTHSSTRYSTRGDLSLETWRLPPTPCRGTSTCATVHL